jgi:TolB-like protein
MAGTAPRFGPFVFDREQKKLLREGRAVSLGGRGTALLAALVDANGGTVSKETLMDAAWPNTAIEEANLTVQIAALRRALDTWSDEQEWIVTVPRVGYRLVGLHAAETQAESRPPAVAVLPFENFSNDPEQTFLADGIVEDIITALSRFRTFAVVARNSSFVYKGRAVDVRDVARELGVRYVLEGSVRRSGDKIRVVAQLIEGSSGSHLWAETFEGAVADIFDFGDEITKSVIGVVEPQIRKAEIERARRKRPESLDAWDLYVQALPLVYSANVSGYTDAIRLLDRAIALDPGFAPALALASWAHEKRKTFGGIAAEMDDVDLSFALVQRAREADPDDALAMALFGWLGILFRNDFAGMSLCVRAVELNPNNRAVLDLAAVAHVYAGDLDEGIALSKRILRLSPGAPDNYACLNHIASAHFAAGRFGEAADWARRSIELEKSYVFSHLYLAASTAFLGRIAEARAEVQVALTLRPDFTTARCGPVLFPERGKAWVDGLRLAGVPTG